MRPGVEPKTGWIEPAERESARPTSRSPATKGGGTVTLSSFAGKRPVALIFGSFT